MKEAYLPFSDAFIQSKGEPLEYRGNVIHTSLKLNVTSGMVLEIKVIEHVRKPEQVIYISTKNCVLLNRDSTNRKSKQIAIYVSEWNELMRIEFAEVKPGAMVYVGNATAKEVRGKIWSGMGNYAMIINHDESKKVFHCRCSQGMWPTKPNFDSLVFSLTVSSTGELDRS